MEAEDHLLAGQKASQEILQVIEKEFKGMAVSKASLYEELVW